MEEYNDEVLDELLDDSMKNYYNYSAKYSLNTNLQLYTNDYKIGHIYVCPYVVVTSGQQPFLQFLLNKKIYTNPSTQKLDTYFQFYEFFYMDGLDIMMTCQKMLNVLFLKETKGVNQHFECNGFLNEDCNMYIFFDCTQYNKDSTVTNVNHMWLALSSEIIGKCKIYDTQIHENITMFFENNPDFLYLKDMYENDYELPLAGYSGSSKINTEFMSVFGLNKTQRETYMGPYYYFTNYENAMTIALFIKRADPKSQGGINRFAVFKGKTVDDVAVPDETGSWANEYDSVYIKYLNLDVVPYEKRPIIHKEILVVKSYEQQVPISYYLLG
jgi:hypothetical protein